jgi:hypothetical protein
METSMETRIAVSSGMFLFRTREPIPVKGCDPTKAEINDKEQVLLVTNTLGDGSVQGWLPGKATGKCLTSPVPTLVPGEFVTDKYFKTTA